MSWISGWSDVSDAGSLIVVGVIFGVVKLLLSPTERGFFCYDTNIRYPYKSSSVPSLFNTIVSYGVPFLAILIIHKFKYRPRFDCRRLFSDLKQLVFFGLSTQLMTHIIKFYIGRLRPHFIDVCVPSVALTESECGPSHSTRYITEYSCLGNSTLFPDPSKLENRLKEARLSFPSGHTSLSFYGMVLTVLIISKASPRSLAASLLQFLCLSYTIVTGISRINDNKHHAEDVLFGALLGFIAARFAASRLYAGEASKGCLRTEKLRRYPDTGNEKDNEKEMDIDQEQNLVGSCWKQL